MTDRIKALAVEVIEAFRSRGISLSLAESCTGGMIAAAVTEKFGGDSMRDLLDTVRAYQERTC